MKFKTRKILIICLIATLAISMISAVSAATISPTTPGGLEKAIDDAENGDTINLKNGVYTINKFVLIEKNIKIIGGSNVVFNSKGKGGISIIHYLQKPTVTLEKIKFKNFKKIAIYADEQTKLTVKNCVFTNNQCEYNGAAISSSGSLTISKCIFTNNQAIFGGAINSHNLLINDCTFTNNQAKFLGGAIDADKLTIKNCIFNSNKGESAGSIYAKDLIISDCTFTNNKASSAGGAIFSDKMSMKKCTFTNNQAKFNGGAIILLGKSKMRTITDSKFNKNIAGKKYNAIDGKATLKNVKISPKDGIKV